MIRVIFFIFPLFCGLMTCSKNVDKTYNCSSNLDFSSENIVKQLKEGDYEFAYCLIGSLQDTTITDCEFADRVFSLADYLHFHFCVIDCQDEEWTQLPKGRRDTTRLLITAGYLEYRSSSLFMSKIDNISCEVVDIYEYCRPEILFNEKLRENFRSALEKTYQECK